jgi:hypothetical protein
VIDSTESGMFSFALGGTLAARKQGFVPRPVKFVD